MSPQIPIDQQKIAEFCRKNHIRKLALFGSVLRNDFKPNSDVDILIEFEEGCTPGFAFFTLQSELTDILGRRVDLHTPRFLSRYFRDQVMMESQIQYAA